LGKEILRFKRVQKRKNVIEVKKTSHALKNTRDAVEVCTNFLILFKVRRGPEKANRGAK